jgi:hypothetical protein
MKNMENMKNECLRKEKITSAFAFPMTFMHAKN